MDGACRWRQFWSITVPMLRPTIIFSLIISTIGGLQLFTEPLLFNSGSGASAAARSAQFQTIDDVHVENAIDQQLRRGYGAAVAWSLFLIIALMSAVNFLLVRRISRQ